VWALGRERVLHVEDGVAVIGEVDQLTRPDRVLHDDPAAAVNEHDWRTWLEPRLRRDVLNRFSRMWAVAQLRDRGRGLRLRSKVVDSEHQPRDESGHQEVEASSEAKWSR